MVELLLNDLKSKSAPGLKNQADSHNFVIHLFIHNKRKEYLRQGLL